MKFINRHRFIIALALAVFVVLGIASFCMKATEPTRANPSAPVLSVKIIE